MDHGPRTTDHGPLATRHSSAMPRHLVITVAYEVFGNGTGDVRQHVVEPMERMARVADEFGLPITIFFEAEEYLAFARHADVLKQALGYDPAQLMREQCVALARRGHDLQLHLHPQWAGAELGGRRTED
jgi:hypothetical protein